MNSSFNGIIGIDVSGIERAHASIHYTKRVNPIIQQLKTMLLIDTANIAVFDIHVTTIRTHDTQITPQVVKRNTESIVVLIGDWRYDDQKTISDILTAREVFSELPPTTRSALSTHLTLLWNTLQILLVGRIRAHVGVYGSCQ